jgi:hypothetical protein
MTRWEQYLAGHQYRIVAALAKLPNITAEPLLVRIGESVNRLIDAARTSVCEDRVNVFDQTRINSFLPRCAERASCSLAVNFKPATYRAYKAM